MSLHVGVIGMGNRLSWVAQNMLQWEEDVRVVAVADICPDGCRERMRAQGIPLEGVTFYGTAEEML
ncbi:MAG TPA: hypothetical protein PKE04_20610, partial [Clostridia bacterium]|nr:hypothetical protein [Clostridia bacterium]